MIYSDEEMNYQKKQNGEVICLNDTEDKDSFDEFRKQVIETFEV